MDTSSTTKSELSRDAIQKTLAHCAGGAPMRSRSPKPQSTYGARWSSASHRSKRVAAEGGETRQQLAFLKAHRCAEGQGYLFGRPMPAEKFAAFLADVTRY